jgi:hypothetical protein
MISFIDQTKQIYAIHLDAGTTIQAVADACELILGIGRSSSLSRNEFRKGEKYSVRTE